MIAKVWIYLYTKRTFRELKRDDRRLDWNWPHTPKGRVRFQATRNRWHYVSYGDTKQAVADVENRFDLERIATLEAEIESIRARLIVPG